MNDQANPRPSSHRRLLAVILLGVLILTPLPWLVSVQFDSYQDAFASEDFSIFVVQTCQMSVSDGRQFLIDVFDLESGQQIDHWTERQDLEYEISDSGDRYLRRIMGDLFEVRTWNPNASTTNETIRLKNFDPHEERIRWIDGDSKVIYVARDRSYQIYDLETKQTVKIEGSQQANKLLAYWESDRWLISYLDKDETKVRIYRRDGSKLTEVMDTPQSWMVIGISKDLLLLRDFDNSRIRVVDLSNGSTIEESDFGPRDKYIEVRGDRIVASEFSGISTEVRVGQLRGGDEVAHFKFRGSSDAYPIYVPESGELIIHNNRNGSLRVLRPDGTTRFTFAGHVNWRPLWMWCNFVAAGLWCMLLTLCLRSYPSRGSLLASIAVPHVIVIGCSLLPLLIDTDLPRAYRIECGVLQGAVASAISVASLWIILGTDRWPSRVSLAGFVGAAIWGTLNYLWLEIYAGAQVAVAVPMMAIAHMVSLGMLRFFTGIYLARSSSAAASTEESSKRSLSIRDILVWTVAAAALGTVYRFMGSVIAMDEFAELATYGVIETLAPLAGVFSILLVSRKALVFLMFAALVPASVMVIETLPVTFDGPYHVGVLPFGVHIVMVLLTGFALRIHGYRTGWQLDAIGSAATDVESVAESTSLSS